MFRSEIKRKIELEIARGKAARQEGFEGRARVCARRAAGVMVREYLEQRGMPLPGPSAMDLLTAFQDTPGLPAGTSQVVERLLMRVDENFTLPEGVDLLTDARWLCQALEDLPD